MWGPMGPAPWAPQNFLARGAPIHQRNISDRPQPIVFRTRCYIISRRRLSANSFSKMVLRAPYFSGNSLKRDSTVRRCIIQAFGAPLGPTRSRDTRPGRAAARRRQKCRPDPPSTRGGRSRAPYSITAVVRAAPPPQCARGGGVFLVRPARPLSQSCCRWARRGPQVGLRGGSLGAARNLFHVLPVGRARRLQAVSF